MQWKHDERFPVQVADLRVLANEHAGDAYWHLRLEAPPAHTAAVAGQFFHLLCPSSSAGEPFLRRPMSVYSMSPAKGEIAFLYKVTGVGTTGLATLAPGDSLNVFGPLGVGFTVDAECGHALILARGVGLATMAPLAEALADVGVAATTICSSRSPEAAVGLESFEAFGDVHCVNDLDGSSKVEAVEDLIESLHRHHPIGAAFTCGSNRLASLLRDLSERNGFPSQIALEQQMACALGMCHACVVDRHAGDRTESVRVCTVGPVFDLAETA